MELYVNSGPIGYMIASTLFKKFTPHHVSLPILGVSYERCINLFVRVNIIRHFWHYQPLYLHAT